MSKVITKEYFSEARIAFSKEVKEHPKLRTLLATYEANDLAGKIGEVAAYCNIILDGMYSQEDLDDICGLLTNKLKSSRSIIITGVV